MDYLNEILWSEKFEGGDFDRVKIEEICAQLNNDEINALLMALKKDSDNKCFNRVYGLKEVIYYTQKVIVSLSEEKAKKAKIKNFGGSVVEENEVLTRLFVQRYKQKLPKWVF
ncbi:hypothetical protein LS70_003790 [Helicobacter sp. MIT 11-5569]|uniref:hypothetical protein n=1 Tax=Helicobacter sp. MIT 11-5569 TaxID=1548151 RepID=UPI00051FAC9B|nr:hypothetical protein [Helicobacter sp. MIT 11-5569]TLD83940.1 hypothetical protein LS70_003790 [Helicobacter sp. MIT 11-5569]